MKMRPIAQLPDELLLAHLNAVLESSEDAIISATPAGLILNWSPGAARLYGYSSAEAVGLSIVFLSPPDRQHDLCELLNRIESGDRLARARILRIRSDGISIPVCVTAAPIRGRDGELLAVSFIETDLSIGKMAENAVAQLNQTFEQRFSQHTRDLEMANHELRREVELRTQAEAALRENEIRLQTILDSTYASIYAKDLDERYFLVNNRATAILGLNRDEMIGKTVWDILPAETADRIALNDRQVVESGAPKQFEEVVRFGDEDRVFLSARVPLRDSTGEIYGVCGMSLDITERKRAEGRIHDLNVELQRRTAELEALNREIESFSYSVSHDLRAPLRSMAGFSQALCEDYADRLDDTGRGFLNRIRAASERMGLLIDDLLELSRLSRSALSTEDVDLSAMAGSVLAALQEREQRSIEVTVAPDARVIGDPRLLHIVLDNLIGNAWKFTSKSQNPRIEFGISEVHSERAFFVKDNGAGFDPRYAGKLFGAFQRLHSDAEYPGTGIGLATVQRIVHRHGGKVWAEGSPGVGATFYFTIGAAGLEDSQIE